MIHAADRVSSKLEPTKLGVVLKIVINMSNEPVGYRVRWDDGTIMVEPLGQVVLSGDNSFKMTPERAAEIAKYIRAKNGWTTVAEDGLGPNPTEDAEIHRFWTRLPGNTSYYDAVRRMAKGEHQK